jgi:hypothetical protein
VNRCRTDGTYGYCLAKPLRDGRRGERGCVEETRQLDSLREKLAQVAYAPCRRPLLRNHTEGAAVVCRAFIGRDMHHASLCRRGRPPGRAIRTKQNLQRTFYLLLSGGRQWMTAGELFRRPSAGSSMVLVLRTRMHTWFRLFV